MRSSQSSSLEGDSSTGSAALPWFRRAVVLALSPFILILCYFIWQRSHSSHSWIGGFGTMGAALMILASPLYGILLGAPAAVLAWRLDAARPRYRKKLRNLFSLLVLIQLLIVLGLVQLTGSLSEALNLIFRAPTVLGK